MGLDGALDVPSAIVGFAGVVGACLTGLLQFAFWKRQHAAETEY